MMKPPADARTELIEQKIQEIDKMAHEIPGVLIIHTVPEFTVEYMSPMGQSILQVTIPELKTMGKEYYSRYFNEEDAADYVPKVAAMLAKNDPAEQVSFFQQVRRFPGDPWVWYFSTTRVLLRWTDDTPLLTITIALPVDPMQHVTPKVKRMLDENTFSREHYRVFMSLTRREREVLKLLALSCSAAEIAEKLVISVHTVETHRKNLRKKLNITNAYELSRFASAFDLI